MFDEGNLIGFPLDELVNSPSIASHSSRSVYHSEGRNLIGPVCDKNISSSVVGFFCGSFSQQHQPTQSL